MEKPADLDPEFSDTPQFPWRDSRDAVFALLRDTKWIAAVSVLLSALLYFPSQVEELYRSVLADSSEDPLGLIVFHASIVIISLLVWFGANQTSLASEAHLRITPFSIYFGRLWPALLGVAPLLSSALGQISSIPRRFDSIEENTRELLNTPGSIWDKLDVELARSVGNGLLGSGRFSLGLCLIFVGMTAGYSAKWRPMFRRLNRRYFGHRRSFVVTAMLIASLTAAFIFSPVSFPQLIGPFGILAAFALCVVMFSVHLSLMTITYRFPFMPIMFAGAALFSFADLNDNHQFRTFDRSRPTNLDTVEDAFDKWLKNRPDLNNFKDEYPVYLVAAQGGGIYAANQSALFLARLQDVCPAFRDHLFAISAVSGGSVGAAIFASALEALPDLPRATSQRGSCPDITRFLTQRYLASELQLNGVEKYATEVLSSDFLSPLMAAAFFSDFSQRFLPFRAPFLFDRAAAFEFSLEEAASKASSINLLKQDYLSHWHPEGSTPALLLNATDVGSGRRVLFAPFVFGVARSADKISAAVGQQSGNDSLIHYLSLRHSTDPSKQAFVSLRLSTAASVSARFPWVSPPATVEPEGGSLLGSAKKIRLVDGGYVDNSGVETALDLREALEQKIAEINAEMDAKRATADTDRKYPRIVLKLIVLGGGSYPTRTSFGLGETMEPIRALLSTRQSRAYVAINRASRIMPPAAHEVVVHGSTEIVMTSDLRSAKLENQYYDLPLGWSISRKTRDIIRKQSGRYWDCEFSNTFTQSSAAGVSETDCVQLFVYHQLNQSVAGAIQDAAVSNHYNALVKRPTQIRFSDADKNEIIRCYAADQPAWRLSQSIVVHALLDEWGNYPNQKDVRQLAYILGTAAHETSIFRIFSDSLSYSTPEQVARFAQGTRRRFSSVDKALPYVAEPEKLANYIYGNRPDLGNVQDGDGWRFRSRGIFPITGRENYRKYALLTSTPLEEEPDLMSNRYIGANVAFAFFFKGFNGRNILSPYFSESTENWVDARDALPGLPKIGNRPEGANEVASQAKKFNDCIAKLH